MFLEPHSFFLKILFKIVCSCTNDVENFVLSLTKIPRLIRVVYVNKYKTIDVTRVLKTTDVALSQNVFCERTKKYFLLISVL